jgi:hypothetical protein
VVEPVRAGDCKGESLLGDVAMSPVLAFAFSPPVMASEIARRPMERGFLKKECEDVWAAGEGEARPVDDVSLPGMCGEFAMASIVCESYESLVTAGFVSFVGFRGRTKSNVLELRSFLPPVPKYCFDAAEVWPPGWARESTLPILL